MRVFKLEIRIPDDGLAQGCRGNSEVIDDMLEGVVGKVE